HRRSDEGENDEHVRVVEMATPTEMETVAMHRGDPRTLPLRTTGGRPTARRRLLPTIRSPRPSSRNPGLKGTGTAGASAPRPLPPARQADTHLGDIPRAAISAGTLQSSTWIPPQPLTDALPTGPHRT